MNKSASQISRRIRTYRWLLLVISIATVIAGFPGVHYGQPAKNTATSPEKNIDIDRVLAELEPEIQRTLLDGKIPSASVALISGDKVVWTGAYGYSNVWARTPATTSTVY